LVASSQAGVLDKDLLKSFTSGDTKKDVIVEFPSVAESVFSSSALSGLSEEDKRNKMVEMLRSQTQAMQAPIINSLSAFGIKKNQIESFWVANKFAIKGVSLGPLQALSALPGVFTVREPFKAKAFPIEAIKAQVSLRQTQDEPQWNIKAVDAPSVWATGNIGSGTVVGIIDTGVNQYHIALASNYKNDQYSWKDAFGMHNTPYDGNGHGTHCTGTICGNANGIGVAPGAKCK
jgi:subtilisin family serine protease